MIDSLKVGRKITESKYLNQENSFRYRNILRIAFYKYEKMKYWLDQNEIYEEIKKLEDFENYNVNSIVFFRKTQKKKRSRMIKKYNTILNYMNKMELALKLQEAQLLKDSKIFEELGKCIQTTVANLEELLLYGENVFAVSS